MKKTQDDIHYYRGLVVIRGRCLHSFRYPKWSSRSMTYLERWTTPGLE
jgi:hypothetical protein